MRALKIRHIPIVDAGGIIVGLENLDEILDITATRPNAVVLVAGGTGNRLRPLTENTPKPLLNVGGRPLIDSIIDRFVEQGFRKFFLSVNYKAEMFEQHCGDGRRWGASISYIHEDRPLGTAGALGLINAPIEDPVLVMNADVLTKVDFRQMLIFHAEHQASATMAVREYGLQVPFGVVHTEGSRITGIDEKPEHSFFVNAGIYVLGPEALRQIRPQEPLDMPELFERLIGASKQTAAYPVCEYWIDVGRHDDFARANAEYDEMFR
jgi:NDP-sugar pyrophosphorylase family protein